MTETRTDAAPPDSPAPGRVQETLYRLSLALKGIDGLVELVVGVILWFDAGLVARLLAPLAGTDADDGAVRQLIANWAGKAIASLYPHPSVLVIVFLFGHGVLKLVLVYCLLREFHWVYPWALGVLALFLVGQIVSLVAAPSVGSAALAVLDVVIIVLVWREWRILRRRRA
ncbi:DUF2127 domain-containing protein [Galbitalea soli]|uniref:DUF2127 domain-containing protein n=1 Tax=Galbitalea soli TaxID=1268042 RepID=A0A7C9TP49_9MICO|nr:DUF2127 domain-containing protein [Galbitalea soli]NYJ30786.1 putative membrane protein [Galbitalea soli]